MAKGSKSGRARSNGGTKTQRRSRQGGSAGSKGGRQTTAKKKPGASLVKTASAAKKTAASPVRAARVPDAPAGPIPLHILSDSTGNLANHMLTAFLTQFPREAFEVHHHHFLATDARLQQAMDKVEARGGIVFHALVSDRAKEIVRKRCEAHGIHQCDLTGQFVQFLADASGVRPQPDVRKLHHTHSAGYNQRIKALEFTLEHDDGLGLETLHEADIVLAGVSRTSKTPTSIYLAQQGFRVANVSLAINVAPPKELLALRERVVGLTIEPMQLVEIRTHRNVSWRMGDTTYNDPEHVNREIMWCRRLFRQQGWPILNVTDQAIEETAAKVTDLLGLKLPTQA